MVAFPCGSRSINNTRRLAAARLAARLILVVVFPTPPFWLVIASIFTTALSLEQSRHSTGRPGSVLTTESVHDVTEDAFDWSFAGKKKLKGVKEPVPLFRAREKSSED